MRVVRISCVGTRHLSPPSSASAHSDVSASSAVDHTKQNPWLGFCLVSYIHKPKFIY
ncbi:BnaC02g45760D [Brassica napus]|uniref:BnaC02g45760D protein n=1 Tax=Brassica napus TaxID=3708 RepID=A0A078IN47_BRANA|nr:BnaC02g45760D [Brassica napus]